MGGKMGGYMGGEVGRRNREDKWEDTSPSHYFFFPFSFPFILIMSFSYSSSILLNTSHHFLPTSPSNFLSILLLSGANSLQVSYMPDQTMPFQTCMHVPSDIPCLCAIKNILIRCIKFAPHVIIHSKVLEP